LDGINDLLANFLESSEINDTIEEIIRKEFDQEDIFEILKESQDDVVYYENSFWKITPEFEELEDIN